MIDLLAIPTLQTWERLRAVKATYDPTNLFRGNQNIPPAAVGDGDRAR